MYESERVYLVKCVTPSCNLIVELGSWMGKSSERLALAIRKVNPNAKLFCIDPFDDAYYKSTPGLSDSLKKYNIFEEFKKRMAPHPHTVMRTTSALAVKEFQDGTVDLLFIDADHSYEAVANDIAIWRPKMRSGGIMCGHDYSEQYPGVKMAVNEMLSNVQNPVDRMWSVTI
jgi:predicted O-methyltransferase YrrM